MTKSVLTLARRVAKLGGHLNVRTEKHGDEDVPAVDFEITGLMLEADELNALCGDKVHKSLYRRGKADDAAALNQKALDEPIFATLFKPFGLLAKFEEASVDLVLDADVLTFDEVKLKGITLDTQTGGLTACDITVQVSDIESDDLATLSRHLNRPIETELSFGQRAAKSKKQPELPMGSHSQEPDAEQPPATH